MAEMNPGMRPVESTAAGIMPGNPAMPGPAIVPRNPNPVVPFMPVTPAMIIRAIPNADREVDRLRLRRQGRGERHDRCQKNQNFRFHTFFDYLLLKLFTARDYSQTLREGNVFDMPETRCRP